LVQEQGNASRARKNHFNVSQEPSLDVNELLSPHLSSSEWESFFVKAKESAERGRKHGHSMSLSAILLAELTHDLERATKSFQQVKLHVESNAKETLNREAKIIQTDEARVLESIQDALSSFLKGSERGERALHQELSGACGGNSFSWRNVQELVAVVVQSYKKGMQTFCGRLIAQEASAIASFLERASEVVSQDTEKATKD
jgi:hypothetical protein